MPSGNEPSPTAKNPLDEESDALLDLGLEQLDAAERILQYRFENRDLLVNALTHSSTKSSTRPSNERLEFLGDAILGLVISDHLYNKFPESPEGILTRLKSILVSAKSIGVQVRRLGLDKLLYVSRGLQKNQSVSRSMCADLFEAIVGAIYLDSGLEEAQRWILRELGESIKDSISHLEDFNWKSQLQQHTQKHLATVPEYVLEKARGPDHCPSFIVSVFINEVLYGRGEGTTKKAAQQQAARVACEKVRAETEQKGSA